MFQDVPGRQMDIGTFHVILSIIGIKNSNYKLYNLFFLKKNYKLYNVALKLKCAINE